MFFFRGIDINWIYQKRAWVAGTVNDNGTILSTTGRISSHKANSNKWRL